MISRKKHLLILASFFVLCTLVIFTQAPMPQDVAYHNFADKREFYQLQNFFDVLSNIPFIVVGIIGVITTLILRNNKTNFANKIEIYPFIIAFLGIALVGLGSGYYHLNPNNQTLVWDRLPMSVGFMAIFSIIIIERIDLKNGLALLPLLIFLGVASIWYWNATEQLGLGDLRPYGLIQFFPILAIPLIIILFPPEYSGTKYLIEVLVWYLLAKIFEYFDHQIFTLTSELVSGHTLKHIAAAIATYSLVRYIKNRKALA